MIIGAISLATSNVTTAWTIGKLFNDAFKSVRKHYSYELIAHEHHYKVVIMSGKLIFLEP